MIIINSMTIYRCESEAQLVKILHFWLKKKWRTWQYHKLVDINTHITMQNPCCINYAKVNCLISYDLPCTQTDIRIARYWSKNATPSISLEPELDNVCRETTSWQCSNHFLAKEIFIGLVGVILNPWRASLAAPAWISLSNSTNAMSCRPGTSRTSLKPGNLHHAQYQLHS